MVFSGKDSQWSDPVDEVKNFEFPRLRNQFLKEKLGGKTILEENGTMRAIVLLCFEVARRVRVNKTLYPIAREETIEAINEVMRTAGKEEYKTKVIR